MKGTFHPRAGMGHDPGLPTLRPGVARYIGGRRGFVDGALPPVGFVAVNAVAGAFMARPDALRAAIATAVGTGLALVALRLARREPLQQAFRGLVGLAIAAVFAARTGEARDFFLPGIYVDAAWAAILATSIVAGRPLIGFVHAALFGRDSGWRSDTRLRRAFAVVTLGWAAVYATRALVQAGFYRADEAGLLAASKLILGWPLTLVAVALTLIYVRRATPLTNGSSAT
ncbi:MAG: DUF3159 domain-containing protein [Actinomycetes bacterium]